MDGYFPLINRSVFLQCTCTACVVFNLIVCCNKVCLFAFTWYQIRKEKKLVLHITIVGRLLQKKKTEQLTG